MNITLSPEIALITITVLGLIIGSFLSVCIYRIPYGRPKGLDALKDDEEETTETSPVEPPGEDHQALSLTSPARSFCPSCKTQLSWYHNIPVVSWLFLRGRCAFCNTSISFRYPLVELLSGIAATLCVLWFGMTLTAALLYIFCAALIVISFIDIDYFIIPDVISLPGTAIAIALVTLQPWCITFAPPIAPGFFESMLGILAGAGFLWVVAKIYVSVRNQPGLGLGDVKLLAMTGALLGPQGALYTIFVGSVLGSLFGGALMLIKGRDAKIPIQFGPFLAGGTILYIFIGYEPLMELRDNIVRGFIDM